MNRRRVWAMTRKEFLHVLRDPRSLVMAIAIPIMMMLLFGFALTLDVEHVPMVVWDQSRSPASRDFISQFSGSRYFSVRSYVQSYPELERTIDLREALLALVIPRDFAGQMEAGLPASVQIIADGSDSMTATIALGYAEGMALLYSQSLTLAKMQRAGGRTWGMPLELRPRVWFNPELQSRNFIIPGIIAVIMMVIAALLTSLTVAREWERGTMEQLISTPVKSQELVLGKIIPYFLIGLTDVTLAVLMGQFVFHVPLTGSVALIFLMAAIFLAGGLGMGLLISIQTKTQLLANQLAMLLTFLPSFLLSGFTFPISNMPKVVQVVTYLVPARYFITILKGIYLKGIGLEVFYLEAVLLTVFGMVILAVAQRKFRKKLE
jgi:ABC-2 type transport system permease protein